MESLTLQPIARVDGTINLPGSKSVSNRALLLAALANGTTVLTNLLDSDDVRHMLNALKALGVHYTLSDDRTRCEVTGNGGALRSVEELELFLGNALRGHYRRILVIDADILYERGDPARLRAADHARRAAPGQQANTRFMGVQFS